MAKNKTGKYVLLGGSHQEATGGVQYEIGDLVESETNLCEGPFADKFCTAEDYQARFGQAPRVRGNVVKQPARKPTANTPSEPAAPDAGDDEPAVPDAEDVTAKFPFAVENGLRVHKLEKGGYAVFEADSLVQPLNDAKLTSMDATNEFMQGYIEEAE